MLLYVVEKCLHCAASTLALGGVYRIAKQEISLKEDFQQRRAQPNVLSLLVDLAAKAKDELWDVDCL